MEGGGGRASDPEIRARGGRLTFSYPRLLITTHIEYGRVHFVSYYIPYVEADPAYL